ncbi:MAG: hypothetical protein EVJ48_09355 [Candidatus Acidulodesulfobacterium acidiphilum]|uniref:Glycine zipper domain-containing protein n=1 Tax=Candidatus Acidulodesulfobacterium acidiphilum TaxID=2597224 RepID=A0A520X7X5_9DELT|nr:MAG: hypothetical protein EVJ48_09355 [Candidatus Acidulodesulfobacterium acidiphilum]
MKIKKKITISLVLILAIFLVSSSLSGCATSRATAASGTTGAIFGAGTGFVVGALTGGPIGAIIGTAAGLSIGYGVGYVTGKYVVTREGRIRGLSMLNVPYQLASNEFIYDPQSSLKINFNHVKGVLISNLKIFTVPKSVRAGGNISLNMEYDVLGTHTNLDNSDIQETRILEGLNGKILYTHTSATNIVREGYYKTVLSVKLPKKTPKIYIYEAIIKVNNVITALSSKLIAVK